MLAWLAFVIAPFPEFDPWKAKERWSDLPTFENIVKECMLSYDHFFDFDRVEDFVDLLLVQRVLVHELGEPVAERAAGRRGVRDEAREEEEAAHRSMCGVFRGPSRRRSRGVTRKKTSICGASRKQRQRCRAAAPRCVSSASTAARTSFA